MWAFQGLLYKPNGCNILLYFVFILNQWQRPVEMFFKKNVFRTTFSSIHYVSHGKTIQFVNFIHTHE